MRFPLLIIFMLGSFFCLAQNFKIEDVVGINPYRQALNCETVKARDGYFYFPPIVLKDSVDCLRLTQDSTHTIEEQKTITFYWGSPCNDGAFDLNITPTQIYFTSSHDNPSPNYLFWAMGIDSGLYATLLMRLSDSIPVGFAKTYRKNLFFDTAYTTKFLIPDEWTDSLIQRFYTDCGKEEMQQMHRYFNILNGLIMNTGLKFTLPPRTLLYGTKQKLLQEH